MLITRTGLILNLVLTGTLAVLGYALSRIIMGFFITSPPVIDLAQRSLHIVLWSSVVFGMSGVFSGVMRASGTVFAPTALSISAIALIEVPLGADPEPDDRAGWGVVRLSYHLLRHADIAGEFFTC